MPHVLHTIWLDSHEPTNKDTLWIKPLKKDYYGIFVYGSNGWTLTTALFKGTIGEFVVDQLPEATTESNGVMSAQDKRDLEMLKEALANIDVIIEAINNIDQTPTEGSQHMVTSGGVYESLEGKVDVVDGKGLSANDYTDEDKDKLASVEEDANKNAKPDWNESDTDSDAFIRNKPDLSGLITNVSPVNMIGIATNKRPTLDATAKGFCTYDTTINKPIWYTGSGWVDATGAAI